MSGFGLLREKRFGPFFLVQFFGAFNDNVFKNAMVLLLAFAAANESDAGAIAGLAAGTLILPFFIFSPIAGQLCDRLPKSRIIRTVKFIEILIMAFGAFAFWLNSSLLLFVTLFCLGVHSAFFGPAKFSILPQVMHEDELVGANALVELGTFLAIILGTITGGVCKQLGWEFVGGTTFICALAGYLISRQIPEIPASSPDLKIQWNPVKELGDLWRIVRKNNTVFQSILGISWFWFLGTCIMSQLPSLTKFFLHGDESVVTLLLAVFCTSIGIGSVACEKLSGKEIEVGLVPLGAAGISLFFFDLSFLPPLLDVTIAIDYRRFIQEHGSVAWRLLFDLFGMGFAGALYIIPLNALIQHRSPPKECSRVIAGTNIINAVFMVIASVLLGVFYKLGLTTMQIFLVLALLNIAVSVYMFLLIPEFTMRFILWCLASTIYRMRYNGRELIPKTGPAIVVANHVSYIDWFIVAAACRRPVRFVMYYKFFEALPFRWFFKLGKAIPIASSKESETIKAQAFALIRAELADGNLICIFPEGTLTSNGWVLPFRTGIEGIQKDFQAPVIPLRLRGLWGSYFSRSGGKALAKVPKPRRRIINVDIHPAFPGFVSAADLEAFFKGLEQSEPEPQLLRE